MYPRLNVPMLWRTPGMVATLGRTVNMSLGGARVFSDERLRIGTKLNLELLAEPDSTLQVLARVVWVDELETGSPARYDVGLEFLEVPERMLSRLVAILEKDEDYRQALGVSPQEDLMWGDDEEDADEKKQ
jgi:hypothetical protein